ncbi:MAG: hypothetical protein HYX34_07665 [Actinobacteria bacterium]|nr:hypothetical protein [Actinomycetota bacterium]
MPTIPDFPVALSNQHHNWHGGFDPGGSPGRSNPEGTSGAGLEFLQFHRNFLAQFFAWYNAHTFTTAPFDDPTQKQDLVAPWTSVPDALKNDGNTGWSSIWADAETRLATGTPDFSTADELGTFIETGIHDNYLHGAVVTHFGEGVVGGFHSPASTWFYKIHGLVDGWWSSWQMRHKIFTKEILIENPKLLRPEVDDKRLMIEVDKRFNDVKAGAFDVPDVLNLLDPVERRTTNERLSRVEAQLFPSHSVFIAPEERPPVGEVAEDAAMRGGTSGG